MQIYKIQIYKNNERNELEVIFQYKMMNIDIFQDFKT